MSMLMSEQKPRSGHRLARMQRMSARLAGDLVGQMEAQAASAKAPLAVAPDRLSAVNALATIVESARDTPAGQQAAWVALSQLQGMSRGNEISYLNSAAAALAGVTGASGLVAAFFAAFGFQSADFQRLFLDHAETGLALVVLIAVALVTGTFAVAIDAGKSNRNLWAERAAVYIGVLCLSAGLLVGAVGLTGGSGGSAPELTTALDSSGANSVVTFTAKAHAVPRASALHLVVWGTSDGKSWFALQQGSSGSGLDGTALVVAKAHVGTAVKVTEVAAAAAVGPASHPLDGAAPPGGCAQRNTSYGIARSCLSLTPTAGDVVSSGR